MATRVSFASSMRVTDVATARVATGVGAGWPLLATVALGAMLAPLNSTMIAVALPRIAADFRVATGGTSWLVIAYLVAVAGVQPVAGKLGDRFGRRWLVLGGLLGFALTSCGAALAPTLPILISCRTLGAVAGALVFPNGIALLREAVPAAARASRFGLVGAAVSCAAAGGPPLGGILVEQAGWRAVFLVNLVLVGPALLLGWRALPSGRPTRSRHPFDLVGALALSALLVGAAVLLTRFQEVRQAPFPTAMLLGSLLLAGIAAFLWRERRHPDPVLQPRLFTRRTFAAANAANALSNLTLYVTLLAVPLLLAGRGGWTSASIGLVLATLSIAQVVCAPTGGRLADRFGRRRPAVGGLTLLALGTVPLAVGGGTVSLPALLGGLGLIGLGLGLASAGMQTAAVEAVGSAEAGVAAGIFSTSRYLGSIVGTSVLGGLLGAGSGFGAVFLLVALAGVGAALASLGLRDWPAGGPLER